MLIVILTEEDFIKLVNTKKYKNIVLSDEDIEDISCGGILEKYSKEDSFSFSIKNISSDRIFQILNNRK